MNRKFNLYRFDLDKLEHFESWLIDRGCEILPKTNQYEALRFRGIETGVIYTSGKFSGSYVQNAWHCYCLNKKWNGRPKKTNRMSSYSRHRAKLIERDGTACFYCGKFMFSNDRTIEHLIPLTAGGKNGLANEVLAHSKCNNKMNSLPLIEKIKYAVKRRTKTCTLTNFFVSLMNIKSK